MSLSRFFLLNMNVTGQVKLRQTNASHTRSQALTQTLVNGQQSHRLKASIIMPGSFKTGPQLFMSFGLKSYQGFSNDFGSKSLL